ncbi:hypothetical protein BDF14DRAFT_1305142 [Spinellus fusiger]|nr:hypothetical protein BDF14DRAFT_1305142 [Spinellus fusiger]
MDMVDPEDASWLVPEGYLSDNEGVESEEEDIEADHSQESKRTRARQSLRPLTRKSMSIRQIIIGPTFENSEETAVDDCLKLYETKMLIDCKDSYDPFLPGDESNTLQTKAPGLFTKEHTDVLMNIIDGKADNMSNILLEAKSNWLLRDVSKRQIEAKIKDIAVKEKRGTDTKPAWYMKE